LAARWANLLHIGLPPSGWRPGLCFDRPPALELRPYREADRLALPLLPVHNRKKAEERRRAESLIFWRRQALPKEAMHSSWFGTTGPGKLLKSSSGSPSFRKASRTDSETSHKLERRSRSTARQPVRCLRDCRHVEPCSRCASTPRHREAWLLRCNCRTGPVVHRW